MIRSLSIPMVSSAIKDTDEFKQRVRRNDDAKEYLHNMKFNEQVLTSNFERQQELAAIPKADIAYSKTVLSKETHYYHKRQQGTVPKYTQLKNKSKRPNAAITISGVEYTPLLLGQVQIGTIHSSQWELLVEELMIRSIHTEPKELITKLKQKLMDHEHPNTTNTNAKKYFFPRLFTATDWHRDRLEETLAKIMNVRRRRDKTV